MKQSKLMAKIPKERDLELHIRKTSILDVEFVDIRDFYPSTGEYGRGILIERHTLPRLIEELETVNRCLGGSSAGPSAVSAEQGQLL